MSTGKFSTDKVYFMHPAREGPVTAVLPWKNNRPPCEYLAIWNDPAWALHSTRYAAN